MEQMVLYELKSLYRDNFRITGTVFGKGEKSLCVMGNMRGNEYQQIYICSQLIKRLKVLEAKGRINPGHQILVVPSANPYSINIEKRFWPTDNTDINRMFPGYDLGETTQRISAGIFDKICTYKYGIQLTSFYMPGDFCPHVRIMKTEMDYLDKAKEFGLPYVVLREPRPYDTTTLNYNWQIWGTCAFSLYSTSTDHIDEDSADQVISGILNFLCKEGMINYKGYDGYLSQIIRDEALIPVRPTASGIFRGLVHVNQKVTEGQELAYVIDPCSGAVTERILSPTDGIIFFVHNHPMTYTNTAVYKIIPAE